MASKSSRKSHSAASATTVEVSTSSDRPASPLSPSRMTRIQEKHELQNLNDRLAVYIERVRHLEQENSRLSIQMQTSHETVSREFTSIKTLYEKELNDARAMVDQTAKDRAKIQIDLNKFQGENEELNQKLNKKEKDLAAANKRIATTEPMIEELKNKTNQLQAEKKRADEDLKEALSEVDALNKQMDVLRKQLQEETLLRVDLENRNLSLKEELQFKEQVHLTELEETRTLHQSEITDVVSDQIRQTEERFEDQLRELREENEHQLRINREDIERKYEGQIQELQNALENRTNNANATRTELQNIKSKYETIVSKVGQLESLNHSLNNRIKDLELLIEQEREWKENALQSKDEQINQLREEIKNLMTEYHDLLDIKVALDMEISAYRKLLEGEENRLNLSSSQPSTPATSRVSSPRSGTPRGTKRKRTIHLQEEENIVDIVVKSDAKGDVEVNDQDQEGKFVKLFNKGEKEVSLSGWQVIRKAGELQTNFKFHRSAAIKPNTYVTIWSSDSNAAHNPPTDLVMKGQKWFVADVMTTTLLNNSAEEVAVRETTKKMRSTLAHRTSEGFLRPGESPRQAVAERCSIM